MSLADLEARYAKKPAAPTPRATPISTPQPTPAPTPARSPLNVMTPQAERLIMESGPGIVRDAVGRAVAAAKAAPGNIVRQAGSAYGTVFQALNPDVPQGPRFQAMAGEGDGAVQRALNILLEGAASGAEEHQRTSVAEMMPQAAKGGALESVARMLPSGAMARDVASTALVGGPSALAVGMEFGVPATMAAMQVDKIGQAAAPANPEAEYDQKLYAKSPVLADLDYAARQLFKDARSPDAVNAGVQGLLMGTTAALQGGKTEPNTPRAAVERTTGEVLPGEHQVRLSRLAAPQPEAPITQPDAGSWGWQPLREKLAGNKFTAPFINANDVTKARLRKRLVEADAAATKVGATPKTSAQIEAEVEAAMRASAEYRETETLARDLGNVVEDATNPVPAPQASALDAVLPRTEAVPQGRLSPVQSRRLTQVLEKLPKQFLPESTAARLPVDTPAGEAGRTAAYRELYARQIQAAIPNDPMLQRVALDTLAAKRVAEDLSGRNQADWYNYRRTAAELAPINKAELALRQDPANLEAPGGLAARAEALERKKFVERQLQNQTGSRQEMVKRQAAYNKDKALVDKLAGGKKPSEPNAMGKLAPDLASLAGRPLAEIRKALRQRAALAQELRAQPKLEALRESVPAEPAVVKPTMVERAAFKQPRQKAAETTVKDAQGRPLIEADQTPRELQVTTREVLEKTAPDQGPAGQLREFDNRMEQNAKAPLVQPKRRTIYLGEKGVASERVQPLPPQPLPPRERRILTPEEAAAERLSPKQQEVVKKEIARLDEIITSSGLTKKDLKLQAKIAAAQRRMEFNKPLDKSQLDSFQKVHDEAARILKQQPSEATKKAMAEAGVRADTAAEAYLATLDVLQKNYFPTGHLPILRPDVMAREALEDLTAAIKGEDVGLRQGSGTSMLAEKNAYKQRDTSITDLPVAYPGARAKIAIVSGYHNKALRRLEQNLVGSPFVKEANTVSSQEAQLLRGNGWKLIETPGHALEGKWVDETLYESIRPTTEVAKHAPEFLKALNSRLAKWKVAGVAKAMINNAFSTGIAATIDAGVSPWRMARLVTQNLEDHPVWGDDVRRFGGAAMISAEPRGSQALRMPEPKPSAFSEKVRPSKEAGVSTKPYPSTAEAELLYKQKAKAETHWMDGILDKIDAVNTLHARILKGLKMDAAAVYNNPTKLAEYTRRTEVAIRQALYVALREDGFSHEAAKARTMKALVDYSNKSAVVGALERNLVGGMGARFAHFPLAASSRYLDLVTNKDWRVATRALSVPAAFAALKVYGDIQYVEEQGEKAAQRAAKAGNDAKGIERARQWARDQASQELNTRDEFKPEYQKGPGAMFSLYTGKDEKGNWESFDIGRAIGIDPAFKLAQGAIGLGNQDSDYSRNALAGFMTLGMSVGPFYSVLRNKDEFTGAPIMATTKEGNVAGGRFSPGNLVLQGEYLAGRLLPDQMPGVGGADLEAAYLKRKEGRDTSFRGAMGLSRTEGARMIKQTGGPSLNKFNPAMPQLRATGQIEDLANQGPQAWLNSRLSLDASIGEIGGSLVPRIQRIGERFKTKEKP